ncbi:alpha/beta fold hydrolase [Oceanicola sp. 502str15]|uniref:alpha/beta fold hydrolase n=1 Tax=Oceanicola sp. 502str15 TaxID=2696061 RepID=UPI002094B2E7|nr:alpha/beta hydrolase [Oceanicola sp. 502str15]MCO6385281.1 alpha/beta fold hydrolase [Oceanicola sp. 502str15]
MMETAPFYAEIAEAPPDTAAYWVRAEDGTKLRVAQSLSDGPEKGTILVFPGRTEFIETFGRTMEEFAVLGYSTLVLDWRGHGLSDRIAHDPQLGHVGRFSDYQLDVAAMVQAARQLGMPEPWYLLGNSMGACIGLRALIDGLPVSACAFCAPMWDIKLSLMARLLAWPVSWAASVTGKGERYAPGHSGESYILSVDYPSNRRTNDEGMYRYMVRQAEAAPELHTGGPSMTWLHQVLRESRKLSKAPSPNLPCISFCPEEDALVSLPAVQSRMARWPEGTLEFIPGAKHNLLLEEAKIRGRILAKICDVFERA